MAAYEKVQGIVLNSQTATSKIKFNEFEVNTIKVVIDAFLSECDDNLDKNGKVKDTHQALQYFIDSVYDISDKFVNYGY